MIVLKDIEQQTVLFHLCIHPILKNRCQFNCPSKIWLNTLHCHHSPLFSKNGGRRLINHTKNILNYTLKFVVKSLLTAVSCRIELARKDKMILADDPLFKLKIRYFYLKRIYSLLHLKRVYSMTVYLVMSRTRLWVNPHSTVAWMSRNLVVYSFTN